MDSLTSLSATDLAKQIREGALFAVDVVDAHIARIQAVNPQLNVVVMPLFEQARAQAQATDKQRASSGTTYGVYGESASSSGAGVRGMSTDGAGVSGYSAIGHGVFGYSNTGFAGYFWGDVHVNGNLSKGGGSFKIDHPLDPANQYLYHSFVESPDMLNIYNGNVVLDDQGEARVEMPDWFEALNQDFRYQLTPIGAAMPDLFIAQEIKDNTSRIAGGERGMEVSWQVTGIRHVAYANARRTPVEEAKPAAERGLYLHPVELGQPAELGLDYQRSR